MVAFRIKINGKPFCDSEEITALTVVSDEVTKAEKYNISLHASAGEGSLQWLASNLTVGDEILVQIEDSVEQPDSVPNACNFCGKDMHDVSNFITGQLAAICNRCVAEFSESLINGKKLPLGAAIRDESSWTCAFCEKHPDNIPGVIVRNGTAICPECLRVCSDISSDEAGKIDSESA
jgi:hypothetical protein